MESPETRSWRAAYEAGMGEGSDACPGDEAVAALVLGELDADERRRVADHVTDCRRCAASYRALRALHTEAQNGPSRRRRARWPAVAAAAVLAVGLGATLVWLGRAGGPGPMDGALRGGAPFEETVQPADGAVLDGSLPTFSWPAQTGAEAYRLRIYDESAEPLWESPMRSATSVTLPAHVATRLTGGGRYFWTVDVQGRVARPMLGPYWFRVEE